MIIEDGTGLPNADSYAARVATTTYHAARGNDSWATATPTAQDQALVRATDYIEAKYPPADSRKVASQALQWPTTAGLDPRVVRATMILALEALKGPLAVLNPDRGVKSVKEALEGLGSTETVYDDASIDADPYPLVTSLLAPLLKGSVDMVMQKVVR